MTTIRQTQPAPRQTQPAPRQAPPRPAPAAVPGHRVDDVPNWAARALEEVLTPTCWFDPPAQGGPYRITIRFSGRRTGRNGRPGPGDTFSHEETVTGIVPGSGPVAVTAWIRGINPGEWLVTARPVTRAAGHAIRLCPPARAGTAATRPPLWPRRLAVPAGVRTTLRTATLRTAPLPFAKTPGITRFTWAGLVALGMLAGLGLQAALLSLAQLPVGRPVLLSLLALAAGVAGAKTWYAAVHHGRRLDGWCIQGFITGAAVVAAAAPFAGLGIPPGAYAGTVAPGLLIGMAIGRPGCFWAGCCAGRPTASRWGIWSSDRHLGCRRVPAQLLEAGLALAAGLVALALVALAGAPRSGLAAVAALAAYTLGRQFILGLRAEPPRRSPRSGLVTAAAAAAVLIVSAALLAL